MRHSRSAKTSVNIIGTALALVLLGLISLGLSRGCARGPVLRSPPDAFTIYYTCDTRGHIEPCGCSSGMAGGLGRRQTYLRSDPPRDFLLVDAGDVTAGAREWEILELEYILKGYRLMNYHAVNVGRRELALGYDGLRRMKEHFSGFVSANVIGPDGAPVCDAYTVVELSNGYRCGIIGIVDDQVETEAVGKGLRLLDPQDALARLLPELKDKAEYVVLLAFTDEPGMKALAQQFFELDLIVGGNVQKASADPIQENRSAIVFNTDKGKAVGRLEVRPGPEKNWEYQNSFTTLEESMARDTQMAALVEEYKLQLKERDFRPVKDDEEGLSSIRATRSKAADRYVGPSACKECHPMAFTLWSESKHAHAFATLEQKGHQYNPRCLKCHTVGYLASDGYINQHLSAHLKNVSCEACHGRGAHHIEQMSREAPPDVRVKVRISKCVTCHDPDNSPDFNEEQYWQEIAHDSL